LIDSYDDDDDDDDDSDDDDNDSDDDDSTNLKNRCTANSADDVSIVKSKKRSLS